MQMLKSTNMCPIYLTCGAVSNTGSDMQPDVTADCWWSVKGLKQVFAEEKLCWPIDLKNNSQTLANAICYADAMYTLTK